jgi:hypothetical protein
MSAADGGRTVYLSGSGSVHRRTLERRRVLDDSV